MSAVSRAAQGLLGFLDIKSQGENPGQLGNVIAPTIDIQPFLLTPYTTEIFGQVLGVAGAGFNASAATVVPNGKAWIVDAVYVSASAPLGAATNITFRGTVVQSSNLLSRIVRAGDVQASATGALPGSYISGPFVMTPGMALGVHVFSFAGVAQDFGLAARVVEVAL